MRCRFAATSPATVASTALAELRECSDEAREDGYPESTKEALALAEAVLNGAGVLVIVDAGERLSVR